MKIIKRCTGFVSIVLKVLAFIAVIASAFWCKIALYYITVDSETLRFVLPWLFILFWPVAFLFVPKTRYVLLTYSIVAVTIFVVWASNPASNDREWISEYARLAHAEYNGDQLKVSNIRDFDYHGARDDFTVRYQDITYDLNDLEGVDLIMSYWDSHVLIAHTMLIFRFEHARNLVISIETRRAQGQAWAILPGFFNQYELIYVLGTEEDLIKRRITISDEDVFLYPTTLSKQETRALLGNEMKRVNGLHDHPEFYNTLDKNCTTSMFATSLRPDLFHWYNPEVLLNGFADRLVRKLGGIKGDGTYWDFKFNHYISPIGKEERAGVDFSTLIRSGQ